MEVGLEVDWLCSFAIAPLTAAGASWAVWCQQDLDDGTVDNELWQIAGLEAFTHD